MPKEVLIYGPMYQYSAEEFIKSFNEITEADELICRINSEGGSPEYGWGMVAKFSEHKGKKLVKVDGMAHSMALYYLCYADDKEGLDVSQYTVHRAAYSPWFENSEYMTEDMWNNLNAINKKLRAAFEATIDVAKFEALKNVKVADIFSNDTRIDVVLTASEAKKIGLINRIINITPTKKAEITGIVENLNLNKETKNRIAALYPTEKIAASVETSNDPNPIKMTLDKLKTEHPEVYAAAVAIGVANEKDRTGAWLAYMAVDATAVIKGIKEGNTISDTQRSEFAVAAMSNNTLTALADKSATEVKTEEIPGANGNAKPMSAEKKAEVDAFSKAVTENLKQTHV